MTSTPAPSSKPARRRDDRAVELRRLARDKLGRLVAAAAFKELRALPRLLFAEEEVETMAPGRIAGERRLVGTGRVVVVTNVRLLLVEKGFFTGRERIESFPWDQVTRVRAEPTGLEIDHPRGTLRLTLGSPARVGEVGDAIRGHLGGGGAERPRAADVAELVRRKLGSLFAGATELEAMALAEVLDDEEEILDVAYARRGRAGLLVASNRRLLFLHQPLRAGRRRVESHPYSELEAVELDGPSTIRATVAGQALSFEDVAPPERAEGIALVARSRARGGASA